MREVEIREEPTELFKILKFENLVGSGGEAKAVIAEGLVSVNGEVETRKRRKMRGGDVVSFGTEEFRLRVAGSPVADVG